MGQNDGVGALAERFEGMQQELLDLLQYVKRTRSALSTVKDELPRASTALASIEEVTEKAAHNLLALVEKAMESDERATTHFQAIEKELDQEHLRDAVSGMNSAQGERMNILTEMMTELSFQDLTCQTLEKVTRGLSEIEMRILHILDPESAPEVVDDADGVHAGSMSGLSRLEETQAGDSRQAMIDQLLGG